MHPYPWLNHSAQQLLSLRSHLPHAILLHGPAGLGKLALGQAFVNLMLCENRCGALVQGCGTCPSCHWLAAGHHPDLHWLQPTAADEGDDAVAEKKKRELITVEQVRQAIDFLHLSSHRNGLRVVLLQPAEAMNAAAANALLKTLEEPPQQALLVLVSHQASRLLPTILSRCHQLRVNLPETASVLSWLAAQGVADGALCLGLAGGSPLLAATLANEDYQARRRVLLTDLSAAGQVPVFVMAERYAKSAVAEFSQLLQWLQQWVHDLHCVKAADRVHYHQDFSEQLHSLAPRVNLNALLQLQQRLVRARSVVGHPLNIQMELEDILLEYASMF